MIGSVNSQWNCSCCYANRHTIVVVMVNLISFGSSDSGRTSWFIDWWTHHYYYYGTLDFVWLFCSGRSDLQWVIEPQLWYDAISFLFVIWSLSILIHCKMKNNTSIFSTKWNMHKIRRQDVDFLQVYLTKSGLQNLICKGNVDLDNSIWAMM